MEHRSEVGFRLRALTYPLKGVPERFLLEEVDTIFHVINDPGGQWKPAEYLEAVRIALASPDDLAKLTSLSDDCSDTAIREFLRHAEAAIAKRFDLDRG